MAVGQGYQLNWKSAIGGGKETTWGTFATATVYTEFNSEGFVRKIEEKILTGINSQRASFKRILGNESVEGKLEADLNPGSDLLVLLMKQALGGTCSTVQITTGAYTHTLNEGDMESNADTSTSTDTKSLTITKRVGGNHIWSYLGMRVNTMTIKAEAGSPLMVSFDMIGKTATITAALSTTVTYTDVLPCIFHGVTVRTADHIGSITSGTTEIYQSFEITVSNNLQSDLRELGTRQISHLPQGGLGVSLKLQQRFDTTTAYDRWLAETATAFGFWLDTNYSLSSGGASTYSMFIGIPKAMLNYQTPVVTGRDGIVMHDLNYTCLRENTTGSYAIQMKVNNATASYP